MAGFKPKFSGTNSATNSPSKGNWVKKDRPFLTLRVKAEGEEKATLMAFVSEREGKFGKYFSGKELLLGDDGKTQKGADGKTMTTDTMYFFDTKSLKLKAKTGEETIEICSMKASDKFPGCFYGHDADKNSFYLDAPRPKT